MLLYRYYKKYALNFAIDTMYLNHSSTLLSCFKSLTPDLAITRKCFGSLSKTHTQVEYCIVQCLYLPFISTSVLKDTHTVREEFNFLSQN